MPCVAVPRAYSWLIVARAAGEAGALTAPTYRAFDHRHARTHTRAHTHTQQGVLDAQAGLHGQPRAHVPPRHDPGTHAHTHTHTHKTHTSLLAMTQARTHTQTHVPPLHDLGTPTRPSPRRKGGSERASERARESRIDRKGGRHRCAGCTPSPTQHLLPIYIEYI